MQSTSAAKRLLWAGAAATSAVLVLAGCSPSTNGASDVEAPSDGAVAPLSLKFTSYASPTAPISVALQQSFDELATSTDDAVQVEPFWSASLLSAPDGLAGATDGRTDIALISAAYTPAEMPLSQVLGVPFIAPDSASASLALADLYDTSPAFQNEFTANGVHLLAVITPGENTIATTDPIEGPEDLNGLQLRAAGYIANTVQEWGANVHALPATDMYESIERGLIDGYTSFAYENIASFGLNEVATNITDPGTGPYIASYIVINKTLWDDFSDAQREAITASYENLTDWSTEATLEVEAQICDVLLENGGSVTIWGEDTVDEFRDKVGDSILTEWKSSAEAAGADADAFLDELNTALDGVSDHDRQTGLQECASR
ncbi:TRAP transporter substrate-binding protein DctP [Microbacterium sp. A93]|uniref:TRAP transporter substrate-binding protein DctP n=1 Tax=Microbacterium sp. A93 TaxID=3450716 RepID=UPI003F43DE5E